MIKGQKIALSYMGYKGCSLNNRVYIATCDFSGKITTLAFLMHRIEF